ncbi:MAG: hypothetical protein AAFQ14_09825 [Cyanobacteria bacterium J06621_12]
MPKLTLQQHFGSNATIYESEGKFTLCIELTDLQDQGNGGDFTNGLGLDITNITDVTADEYASNIFWALVQLLKQNQPDNNTDDTVGIYVTGQGKRNVIRNGAAQLGFQELLTGYTVDPTGLTLDPDLIGNHNSSSEI